MHDSKDPGAGSGLRFRKRVQGAHARKGSDGAAPADEPERPAPSTRRPLAGRPRREEAFAEDDEVGFDVPDEPQAEELQEDYEDEDYEDDERGRGRRVPSAIALALLVLFLTVPAVGFFARQTFMAPAEPDVVASGQPAGEEDAPAGVEASPEVLPSDGASEVDEDAAEAAAPSVAGGRIEETDLTVVQEDDGQGGMYLTIGDETWHGLSSPEEGAEGDVLKLEGPTAVNINTGFATKDPEAVVDHGSFGIYEPGGGFMYATVQRTKALGAEEATTRGTYTVVGASGEQYSGSYSDSLPDPENDLVVRSYTVEEGLPPEGGTAPEEPEAETLRVAYELPRLEEEKGRPFVPQLVGWHAPDGTKLHEIVDAPKK